jgi:exodeoxyribonuclease X
MTKIRVVDFETTGTEPPAQVIEVGFTDLMDEGQGWVVTQPDGRLCGTDRPVTCETRAIHHIAPAQLAGLDRFYAQPFVAQAKDDGVTAIAAHVAAFEEKWLGPVLGGMPMICTYKAALRAFPDAPNHQNQTLRYWLEEQGIATTDPALAHPVHRAGPDTFVTAHLLRALLGRVSVEDLVAWTKEPAVLARMPIGKQRGAKWCDVEFGFLAWMLRQPDMDPDLKWNAQREINRRAADPKGTRTHA